MRPSKLRTQSHSSSDQGPHDPGSLLLRPPVSRTSEPRLPPSRTPRPSDLRTQTSSFFDPRLEVRFPSSRPPVLKTQDLSPPPAPNLWTRDALLPVSRVRGTPSVSNPQVHGERRDWILGTEKVPIAFRPGRYSSILDPWPRGPWESSHLRPRGVDSDELCAQETRGLSAPPRAPPPTPSLCRTPPLPRNYHPGGASTTTPGEGAGRGPPLSINLLDNGTLVPLNLFPSTSPLPPPPTSTFQSRGGVGSDGSGTVVVGRIRPRPAHPSGYPLTPGPPRPSRPPALSPRSGTRGRR